MKKLNSMRKRGVTRREFLKYSGIATGAAIGSLQGPWIIKARGEKTIKIGQLQALSGVFSAKGKHMAEGTQLAVEEINAKGGVFGRPLELFTADDEGKPGVGKEKAIRLIEKEKVEILTGCISSAVGAAVSAVALEKKVPFFIQVNYATPLTSELCNRYTFRICVNDTMWTKATTPWMLENLGKTWYFQVMDYLAGQTAYKISKEIIEAKGGKVIGVDMNPLGTTDFSSQLMKVRAAKPEVIGILEWAADNVNIMKQIAEFGLDKEVKIGGVTGIGLEESVGVAPGPLGYWGIEWYPDIDTPKSKEFVENYKRKFGDGPTNISWNAYITTNIIGKSLEKAKSTEAIKVISAAEGLVFDNLTGRRAYVRGWDHQGIMDILIIRGKPVSEQQKKGKLDLFEMVAWVNGESVALTKEESKCKMGPF
jgi:branched-chain amino acid transport system substrate-binding protein